MWIEELPNGKYKYCERYKDPYTDKWRRVSLTLDKNSKQAQKQASILLKEKAHAKSHQATTTTITFGDLYQQFYQHWKQTVKLSTLHSVGYTDKVLQEKIKKDTIVQKMDRRYLQKVIDDTFLTHSRSTAYRVRSRLKSLFDYAVRLSILQTNEADYTSLAKTPQTLEELEKKRAKFLSMKEIKSIVDALNEHPYHQKYADIAIVLSLTGMRYGELAGLQLKNIHFKDKTIAISGNYDATHRIKTTPKTRKSIRTIKVPDAVLQALNRQIKRITQRHQAPEPDDFIFCFETWNQPVRLSSFSKILKKYGAQTGITKNLSTHIFRHSHISYLAESGMPIKAIMDRVGHANAKMTLEIYSHTTSHMEQKIVDQLDKLF